MKKLILENLKQRGAAVIEYVVILSFVCVVGWGFVGSDNGMTGSIGSIINSVERLLGMTGVVYVDKENQVHFDGEGSGKISLGNKTFGPNDKWTWSDIWTDDKGERYTGSAFLGDGQTKSEIASGAAKQLIDAMFEDGSFGGVEPMSWAFTEGYKLGSDDQSLNLYWSNSDWSSFKPGDQVPIIQMSQGLDGYKKYYVVMAEMGNNGSIGLWNETAALKGSVTYVAPDNTSKTYDVPTTGPAPTRYSQVATAAPNLDSNLAFTDYNKAQEAYYKLVA